MVHFARFLIRASFLFASVSASSRIVAPSTSTSSTNTSSSSSTPTARSLSVTDQVTGMKGLMLNLHDQASIQQQAYPSRGGAAVTTKEVEQHHHDVKNQDYYNEFIFDKVVDKLMVSAKKEIQHYVENYSTKHTFHSHHTMWEGLYLSEDQADHERYE